MFFCVCVGSLFGAVVNGVPSSFAIILLRKRELVAYFIGLWLSEKCVSSSRYCVLVCSLIVASPHHTHLLFMRQNL